MSASLLHRVAALPEKARTDTLARYSTLELALLRYRWRGFRGRPEQTLPLGGAWRVALVLAGRGWGKTNTGAEWIREEVELGRAKRIALIGPDEGEIRQFMVEGPSGILAASPPWFRPKWYSSRGSMRLVWPNGAIAICQSAEESEFRGANLDHVWWDEPAKGKWLDRLWTNVQLALRGRVPGLPRPRTLFTGTPLPLPFFRLLKEDALKPNSNTIFIGGSSYDNLANLDASYRQTIESLEGSRTGQQEVHGLILEDEMGQLFPMGTIHAHRIHDPALVPSRFVHIVVALDPAISTIDRSDETGIVVLGLGVDGNVYVLEDHTGKHAPEVWAEKAVRAFAAWRRRADKIEIVAEKNRGGDLVPRNLRAFVQHKPETLSLNAAPEGAALERVLPIGLVRAEESKEARAQPVSTLYSQGRIRHVGILARLEQEMSSWIPGITRRSPNGLDALCHGVARLAMEDAKTDYGAMLTGMAPARPEGDSMPALPRPDSGSLDELFGPRPASTPRTL